jgi:hypothetical protein
VGSTIEFTVGGGYSEIGAGALVWRSINDSIIARISISASGYILSYTGFLIASDIRIKKNIRLNTGSLSIINNIQV